MSDKPKIVYIAGPLTSSGNVAVNIRKALYIAESLVDAGFLPVIPHLTHFWHFVFPKDYEWWLALDLQWLEVCDFIIRIPGESKGADREMARAKELGLDVLDYSYWNDE